ncbi:MAG: type IV pilin [Halorhabdus sp.]
MFEKAKEFLLAEDRGVSPVIGVILMVAITVILAAVIATFVMNMGPSGETQPNSQTDWNIETVGSNDVPVLSVEGGEPLPLSEFAVQVDGGANVPLENVDGTSGSGDGTNHGSDVELSAGDRITFDNTGTGSLPSSLSDWTSGSTETITLIWQNPNNDQTQVYDEWEVEP